MRGNETPYGVLGGMISYRAEDLAWSRQVRLRVTEFLTDTPLYTIHSSKEIPEWKIRDVLDSIHPDWSDRQNYQPTPAQTAKQLRALCVKFSLDINQKIGLPHQYDTQRDQERASRSLVEEAL
jgi:hypothetical protein